jgi:hypothetical protein
MNTIKIKNIFIGLNYSSNHKPDLVMKNINNQKSSYDINDERLVNGKTREYRQ